MNNLNDIFFAPVANQDLTYDQVLEDVQRYFAENHASTIAEAGEGNAERATTLLKELMVQYIVKRKYAIEGLTTEELCEKLYEDMAGYSFLKKWIYKPGIEEGSREVDLVKRDENGNILNSVIHLLTRPSENPALNINQDFLLERVLRKHPNVIGVGEMRSAAESLSAAESSRTGHTVCTTIHSNSCNSTYRRMMTLAKRKYSMDDAVLMEIMVEAYPIVVFTKQLEDRSRKIMEILEGEDYRDGQLISHTLYKFEVEDNVTDEKGEIHVVGHHRKVGLISDTLKKRLLDNGISNKELAEFMDAPKEVD